MSTWKAVALIIGVFAMLFIFCALVIWVEKKYPGENYDERQKIARGNAHRLASWVGFVYYILVAVGCNLENASGDTWFSLIMLGVLGQAMVLHIYCFLTHSALPLDDKPVVVIVCWLLVGTLDLVQYFTVHASAGVGLMGYTQLIVGSCFLLLSAMHLLSYRHREKE